MKKLILVVCTAFALVGCKQEGGTSDQYNTGQSSGTSASTNINSAPSTVTTNDAGTTTPSPGTSTNATPPSNP